MNSSRNKRISTGAYQALRDALPVVVWYRGSFARFLRTALRDHPEVLVGLDLNSNKRELADEVVERLIRREDVYQHVTLRLMLEIADMTRFPELEKHQDSDTLLAKARSAVALLKEQTAVHEELIVERQRAEAARAAHSERAELQRRFADDLDELKRAFLARLAERKVHGVVKFRRRGAERRRSR